MCIGKEKGKTCRPCYAQSCIVSYSDSVCVLEKKKKCWLNISQRGLVCCGVSVCIGKGKNMHVE